MCEIADRIRQEGKDAGILLQGKIEDILNKWLKYAARASSFAEFEAKM